MKSQRLTSREVELVMTRGQALFSPFFVVKFLENTNGDEKNQSPIVKTSVVSPKKVFHTAVERNKVRRRTYSALSCVYKRNNLNKNSFLIAIICNKKVLSEKIQTLADSIEQIFKKGAIL